MVIPDPSCPLDQKSAQVVQDLLQDLERDISKICDRLGPKMSDDKELSYFEGIVDATKIILDRLGLCTRDARQIYMHKEDYLMGHKESDNWIT